MSEYEEHFESIRNKTLKWVRQTHGVEAAEVIEMVMDTSFACGMGHCNTALTNVVEAINEEKNRRLPKV